jgi:hypothetical protein
MRVTIIAAVLGMLLYTGTSAGQSGKQPKGKGSDKAPPTRGSQETSSETFGGRTFEQWRKEMTHEDSSRRGEAIMSILNFGPKTAGKAVPDFVQRLHDRDVGARTNACMALRVVHVDAEHVNRVVDALAGRIVPGPFPDYESQAVVRYHAALTLLRFAPSAGPVASKVLIGLHDTTAYLVRKTCAAILWRIAVNGTGKDGKGGPDPKIVQGLLDWMQFEKTYHVRLEILQGLGAVSKPADMRLQARMVSDLTKYATSQNKALAIWAYAALVSHTQGPAHERALKTIASYLHSKDTDTKIQAVMALGGLGKKARNQVPAVKELLQREKDNALIVQGACIALSLMADANDNAVVEALLDLLKQTNPPHKAAAAVKAIVDLKLKDERVIKALDKMLENKQLDDNLTAWVKAALRELRGEKK